MHVVAAHVVGINRQSLDLDCNASEDFGVGLRGLWDCYKGNSYGIVFCSHAVHCTCSASQHRQPLPDSVSTQCGGHPGCQAFRLGCIQFSDGSAILSFEVSVVACGMSADSA
jgi:hypothetical protein